MDESNRPAERQFITNSSGGKKMICRNCGAKLPEGILYCSTCGERVNHSEFKQYFHTAPAVSAEADAADKNIVESNVIKAEINYSGAVLTRQGKVTLKAGNNRFYLKMSSGDIQPESMTIEFAEPIKSCSVSEKEKLVIAVPAETKEKIGQLESQLHAINAKDSIYAAQAAAYEKNSDFTARSNVSVEAALEYMEKLPEIMETIRIKRAGFEDQKKKIEEELAGLRDIEPNRLEAVPVNVNVIQGGEYHFSFKYFDSEVNWEPFYDIKAQNITQPLNVYLKGTVYQATGEDWNNVETSLICGNLSDSANQPKLLPWHVDFRQPVLPPPVYQPMGMQPMGMQANAYGMQAAVSEPGRGNTGDTAILYKPMAVKEQTETMEVYTLPLKQNFTSGDRGTVVDIVSSTVPVKFVFTTTPKLNPSVFLTARITDAGAYNFLACNANLYLEGNYIGQIEINPDQITDTFEISFGRDQSIRVTRSNIRRYTDRNTRSTEQRTYEYEIRIVNQKREPVAIQVHDQIPVSRNHEIRVEDVETGQGVLDPEKGEVTWFYTFEPGVPARIRFSFSVIWPKSKPINLYI